MNVNQSEFKKLVIYDVNDGGNIKFTKHFTTLTILSNTESNVGVNVISLIGEDEEAKIEFVQNMVDVNEDSQISEREKQIYGQTGISYILRKSEDKEEYLLFLIFDHETLLKNDLMFLILLIFSSQIYYLYDSKKTASKNIMEPYLSTIFKDSNECYKLYNEIPMFFSFVEKDISKKKFNKLRKKKTEDLMKGFYMQYSNIKKKMKNSAFNEKMFKYFYIPAENTDAISEIYQKMKTDIFNPEERDKEYKGKNFSKTMKKFKDFISYTSISGMGKERLLRYIELKENYKTTSKNIDAKTQKFEGKLSSPKKKKKDEDENVKKIENIQQKKIQKEGLEKMKDMINQLNSKFSAEDLEKLKDRVELLEKKFKEQVEDKKKVNNMEEVEGWMKVPDKKVIEKEQEKEEKLIEKIKNVIKNEQKEPENVKIKEKEFEKNFKDAISNYEKEKDIVNPDQVVDIIKKMNEDSKPSFEERVILILKKYEESKKVDGGGDNFEKRVMEIILKREEEKKKNETPVNEIVEKIIVEREKQTPTNKIVEKIIEEREQKTPIHKIVENVIVEREKKFPISKVIENLIIERERKRPINHIVDEAVKKNFEEEKPKLMKSLNDKLIEDLNKFKDKFEKEKIKHEKEKLEEEKQKIIEDKEFLRLEKEKENKDTKLDSEIQILNDKIKTIENTITKQMESQIDLTNAFAEMGNVKPHEHENYVTAEKFDILFRKFKLENEKYINTVKEKIESNIINEDSQLLKSIKDKTDKLITERIDKKLKEIELYRQQNKEEFYLILNEIVKHIKNIEDFKIEIREGSNIFKKKLLSEIDNVLIDFKNRIIIGSFEKGLGGRIQRCEKIMKSHSNFIKGLKRVGITGIGTSPSYKYTKSKYYLENMTPDFKTHLIKELSKSKKKVDIVEGVSLLKNFNEIVEKEKEEDDDKKKPKIPLLDLGKVLQKKEELQKKKRIKLIRKVKQVEKEVEDDKKEEKQEEEGEEVDEVLYGERAEREEGEEAEKEDGVIVKSESTDGLTKDVVEIM